MADQSFREMVQQLHIPEGKRYISIQESEGEFIHHWVQSQGLTNTLEVGMAFGFSAACIMAAHDEARGTHTCIDPFQESEWDNIGLTNLEQLGYGDRLNFHQAYSHHALPKLHEEGKQYDFVFIDGGHLYDQVFVDFYYADLLIEPGGYLLLHDAWMRSTQMVAAFIRNNRRDYRAVRKAGQNLILLEKIEASCERPFYHFREFFTLRGFFSQRLIAWLIRTNRIDRFMKK